MCFQVAAAFSFSECAIVIVASKSNRSSPRRSGPAPASHATARAGAGAGRTTAPTYGLHLFLGRVVGIEATGPNNSARSPSTAIPLTASAPSAIATARSQNPRPGECSGTPR